jgi:hypothetical protein
LGEGARFVRTNHVHRVLICSKKSRASDFFFPAGRRFGP